MIYSICQNFKISEDSISKYSETLNIRYNVLSFVETFTKYNVNLINIYIYIQNNIKRKI